MNLAPEDMIGLEMTPDNWGVVMKRAQKCCKVKNKDILEEHLCSNSALYRYRSGKNISVTNLLEVFQYLGGTVILKVPNPIVTLKGNWKIDDYIPPEEIIGIKVTQFNWGEVITRVQQYMEISNLRVYDQYEGAGIATQNTITRYKKGEARSITTLLEIFDWMGAELILRVPSPLAKLEKERNERIHKNSGD